LLGNAAVATIIALCFIFGGVAAGSVQPTLMLAVTVFFAILGREILKTMADYKGDMHHDCNTIATSWGKKNARIFVLLFIGITAAAMLLTYFSEQYSPVYLFLVVFVIYPLLVYIVLKTGNNTDGETLERNSVLMKYGFFIWFLAIALGAGLAV
jgi:4-hydroxybenzoate polyprenyltransferase